VKAGDSLGQKAAQAGAAVIGGLVGAELGASPGTAAVPLLGTALGALAGWLSRAPVSVRIRSADGRRPPGELPRDSPARDGALKELPFRAP
jgi:uncharacterized membrane protein